MNRVTYIAPGHPDGHPAFYNIRFEKKAAFEPETKIIVVVGSDEKFIVTSNSIIIEAVVCCNSDKDTHIKILSSNKDIGHLAFTASDYTIYAFLGVV